MVSRASSHAQSIRLMFSVVVMDWDSPAGSSVATIVGPRASIRSRIFARLGDPPDQRDGAW
jgi:hypothetical protein